MTSATMAFAVRGEGSQTLEIDVYDAIGESFFSEGVSAKSVRATLKEAKGANLIKLRVNSRGGDVIDGFAIYNMLSEHPARVEVDIDALAASMASVVVMAADEIRMAENAMLMVHNPWSLGMGEADDLRAQADVLDKMRDQIANTYAARTGVPLAEILDMMDAETWLSAAEAKAKGFADTVKPMSKKAAASRESARAMASLNLTGLRAPAQFMAAVAQARVAQGNNDGAQRAQENDMTEEQILKALGVKSLSDAQLRLGRLERIEAAVGSAGDECQGVVRAAMHSHAELPKAQARIAELEGAVAAHALDGMIAQAKEAKKLTPAIEASVRAAVAAGDVTIKGAEAWLHNLPPIAALVAAKKEEAAPSQLAADHRWNGKSYAELKPAERAALKRENPDLFAAMRSASN